MGWAALEYKLPALAVSLVCFVWVCAWRRGKQRQDKMSWTLTPSVNTIMSTVLPGSRPKNLRELALKANPMCVCVCVCVWVGSGGWGLRDCI